MASFSSSSSLLDYADDDELDWETAAKAAGLSHVIGPDASADNSALHAPPVMYFSRDGPETVSVAVQTEPVKFSSDSADNGPSADGDASDAKNPEEEQIFFDAGGAGWFNWDFYRVGSENIIVNSWSCCGRTTEAMGVEQVLQIALFQNCFQRRRGRGVITIASTDPTTPVIRIKVDGAVGVFEALRDVIAVNKGEPPDSDPQNVTYDGSYFDCCWGRGCCCRNECGCCEWCCNARTHTTIKPHNIRVIRRNCCFSSYENVSMNWVYDGTMHTRCVCCCCCKGYCQHDDITIFSFDEMNPELHVRMRGAKERSQKVFDDAMAHVDLKTAADKDWQRTRTRTQVDQAHNERARLI